MRKEIPVSFALVETKPMPQAALIELVLTTGDRVRIPAHTALLRTVLSVVRERA